MAAPTSIEVAVDSTEYSRYEKSRNTITATVTVAGGAPYSSEPITVALVKARRDRDIVVAEHIVPVTSASSTYSFTSSFYLPDILDSDQINLVRRGAYLVRAASANAPLVSADSAQFSVRIISVERFREDFLFGLKQSATEVKAVKTQPISITGIEVIDVSRTHPVGFASLNYVYRLDGATPVRTLSWSGGPAAVITGPGTYTLKAGSSSPFASMASMDYVTVRVRTVLALPTATTVEALVVDEKPISDETLANYLDRAIEFVEKELIAAHVEPTVVVSVVDPTGIVYTSTSGGPVALAVNRDYDEIGPALTYFYPTKGSWVSIPFPYMQLLRVDNLYGVVANVRVIDIDLSWVQHAKTGGLVQLIPFNQDIARSFVGLLGKASFFGTAEIPNFWNYTVVAGMRDCPADLIELIGKKAAVEALLALGTALRPGVGSVSLSRDGVSQSVSYLNQQKYGTYTGTITAYQEFLKEHLPKYRARYRGAMMVVV